MSSIESYRHSPAFDRGLLRVSDLHSLYYEQYGRKDGKPVVFVHGGPGGTATTLSNTVFFNPSIYRVVLFDQRGAGKSLPSAELRENNTDLLASDIEALRTHLGIDRWFMVFGGSWGSTLSLFYAQKYPRSVGSLVLRGIFNERKAELAFSRGATGAARIFPQEYEAFTQHLAAEARADPIAAYYSLLTSDDYDTRLSAAKAWNRWDMTLGKLIPDPKAMEQKEETWLLQHARMETHYAVNGGFMEDGQLLRSENLAKIAHIPCSIVNGRYDMFCPPQTAWELHKGLPLSKLYIISDAGHSAQEPGILQKLVEICDEHGKAA